ncbi:MAG: serine/threonine-protein kinase, partial [Gemmataceae bacterium]
AGGHATSDSVRRFVGEAEAVALLRHPNVVQVYHAGRHDGLPYLVLEWVPGGSLADRLKAGPLPPADAAALVERLAGAVHCCHAAGVIHRDLKPANVLLAEDGTPKVTDFGLARRADALDATHSGAVLGTPSYMAPEQAAGSREVGPAADVWALGVILYECLTGRSPFRSLTSAETMRRVMTEEPPAAAGPLGAVALKCLRKDPGRRYGSARELAEDLRRWREGGPVLARPRGLLERALSAGRRWAVRWLEGR